MSSASGIRKCLVLLVHATGPYVEEQRGSSGSYHLQETALSVVLAPIIRASLLRAGGCGCLV